MPNHWRHTAKVPKVRLALAGLVLLAVLATGAWAARQRRVERATVPGNRLALTVAPARRIVAPGVTSAFGVFTDRHRPRAGRGVRAVAGTVLLSIGRLPPASSASFSVNPVGGGFSLLRVRTSRRTPEGTYRLLLRGRSGRRQATRTIYLRVARATRQAVAITGTVSGLLAPGVSLPLDLTLRNPNSFLVQITQITVTLRAVSAPHADVAHPCTAADFLTTQYAGAYGFAVPAMSARSLAAVEVPAAQWPSVSMLDRSSNQDGCKGAALSFDFSASGIWGGP